MFRKVITVLGIVSCLPAMALPGFWHCYQDDNFPCCNQHPVGMCEIEENSKELVYKIFKAKEWDVFTTQGSFEGSEHDKQDGFIHLALGSQLDRIIGKYFSRESQVYIAAFSRNDFAGNLRFESGYPHLYSIPLEKTHMKGSMPYAPSQFGVISD